MKKMTVNMKIHKTTKIMYMIDSMKILKKGIQDKTH